ncbi:MAG: IS91 family transposase [Bacteroidales bacterium]|nr:IS91 family transposase [Bacteroidales bacterium]
MQKQITLGDILHEHGGRYISQNQVPDGQRSLIHLLSACRTAGLGSHFEKCDHCSYTGKSYNSCRNRHCPSCQQKEKLEWIDKRMKELLPVGYYHLVFTLPHELNPLCLQNKKVMYGLLFKAVSQTLLELTRDVKHLGADIGLVTLLHTWGQNMTEHPHLHCIMPAGGLGFDREHWVHVPDKNDFFIAGKVLAAKFRGKFLGMLKQAREKGELDFCGKLSAMQGPVQFNRFLTPLYKKEWVVNVQKPMGNPEKILEYLSRYVFRIAITDRRILEVKNGNVRFSWKDYRTGRFRQMKLDIDEFIRRFLLHVLPKGFFKVRYYGIFSSRYRKQNIETARQLLAQETENQKEEALEDGAQILEKQDTVWTEILECIRNFRQPNCPACKKGRLRFAGLVKDIPWEPG